MLLNLPLLIGTPARLGPALCGRPPPQAFKVQHSQQGLSSTDGGAFPALKNADGMGDAEETTAAGQSLSRRPSHLLHLHLLSTRHAGSKYLLSSSPSSFLLRHPPFIHPLPLLSSDTSILPNRHLLFFLTKERKRGKEEEILPSHTTSLGTSTPPPPTAQESQDQGTGPSTCCSSTSTSTCSFQHRTPEEPCREKEDQDRVRRIHPERLVRA